MGKFVKGAVVVAPFPFSDLSAGVLTPEKVQEVVAKIVQIVSA